MTRSQKPEVRSRKLSRVQVLALQALVSTGHGLLRDRTDFDGCAPSTIYALQRRGLVKVEEMHGCCGVAYITAAGRRAEAERRS